MPTSYNTITIVLDFDGTVVTHEYPKIGKDIGAVPVLKELVDNGHKLVLSTMRANITNPVSKSTNYLDDAVNWFKKMIYFCMAYK